MFEAVLIASALRYSIYEQGHGTGNISYLNLAVRHVTGTGSGLLGGIPRVVVQISALTLKGPL